MAEARSQQGFGQPLLAPTPAEDLDRRGNLHVFNVNELLRPHGETIIGLLDMCLQKSKQ